MYGRMDGRTEGERASEHVETVAPTNFQDKEVNNGPGNRWLVFDRCRNDGFQSLADNNARCRWFINPCIVANLKALSTTGPGEQARGENRMENESTTKRAQ